MRRQDGTVKHDPLTDASFANPLIMSEFPLKSLLCYHSDNKARVGDNNDGGYVIVDGFEYDTLASRLLMEED